MKIVIKIVVFNFALFLIFMNVQAQTQPTPVPAPTPIDVRPESAWCDKYFNEGKFEEAWKHCSGKWGSLVYTYGNAEDRTRLQQFQERKIERLAVILSKLSKSPTIPDDAELYEQKGIGFMEAARAPADFALAIKEFQHALNSAPWVFDFYFNLAMAYKAAGQFKDALNILAHAKILAANDKDRKDVISLRAKIEVAQEMAPKK